MCAFTAMTHTQVQLLVSSNTSVPIITCHWSLLFIAATWGEAYSGGQGGSTSNYPGVKGRDPLRIPANTFVLYFHSDGSVNDWGYRINVMPADSLQYSGLSLENVGYSTICLQQMLGDGCSVQQPIVDTSRFEREYLQMVCL